MAWVAWQQSHAACHPALCWRARGSHARRAPDMGSALPPRHSTARESPALATYSWSRTISATTAVHPACAGGEARGGQREAAAGTGFGRAPQAASAAQQPAPLRAWIVISGCSFGSASPCLPSTLGCWPPPPPPVMRCSCTSLRSMSYVSSSSSPSPSLPVGGTRGMRRRSVSASDGLSSRRTPAVAAGAAHATCGVCHASPLATARSAAAARTALALPPQRLQLTHALMRPHQLIHAVKHLQSGGGQAAGMGAGRAALRLACGRASDGGSAAAADQPARPRAAATAARPPPASGSRHTGPLQSLGAAGARWAFAWSRTSPLLALHARQRRQICAPRRSCAPRCAHPPAGAGGSVKLAARTPGPAPSAPAPLLSRHLLPPPALHRAGGPLEPQGLVVAAGPLLLRYWRRQVLPHGCLCTCGARASVRLA